MKKLLLPSLATLLLGSAPVLADEDTDVKDGETPAQRDERLERQAGHYAAGLKVMVGSGLDDTFNFIGIEPHGHYNVTDAIRVGARLPLSVSQPDGFTNLGGLMARAEIKLGATIGVFAEAGFLKYGAVLESEQDSMAYLDGDEVDYGFATRLGIAIHGKAGPTYLHVEPAFVYQSGDPEAITGAQLPVTALFRAGSTAQAGIMAGLYTGDDFELGAEHEGRLAVGLVAHLHVSKIQLGLGAGFSSLLTEDEGRYTSVGKSLYVMVNLEYAK